MKQCTCKYEPLSIAAPTETASKAVKYDDTTEMEWCEAASFGPRSTEPGSAGVNRQSGGGGLGGTTGDARTLRIDDKKGTVCS